MSLFTAQDAYDHMMDVRNLHGQDVDRVQRLSRRAVLDAYAELRGKTDWKYFQRELVINLTPRQITGTVAYTSATGIVTLTGATWPANATDGGVTISDEPYVIARRVSDTEVLLPEYSRPGADVAAGTSYSWSQRRYLMPIGISDIQTVLGANGEYERSRTTRETMFWQNTSGWDVNYYLWALVPSQDRPGRYELLLSSQTGTESEQIRVLYDARDDRPKVFQDSTGTVSIADDVATFSSGVLSDKHLGAVLRVSVDATVPTTIFGRYDRSENELVFNEFDQEFTILEVTNSTSAILRTSGSTATTRGYTLSSIIDVEQHSMLEYYKRLMELAYDRLTRADGNVVGKGQAMAQAALIDAMASDGHRMAETYRAVITYLVTEDVV